MATKLTKKTSSAKQPIKKTATNPSPAKNFIRGLGRRKTSIARVRIFKGKAELVINNQPASKYWDKPGFSANYLLPFKLTKTEGKYTASAKIVGGGINGQIGAFVHGVARALVALDEKNKPVLKKAGLMTRDPRMKETRKPGRRGKARFKPQSPKR